MARFASSVRGTLTRACASGLAGLLAVGLAASGAWPMVVNEVRPWSGSSGVGDSLPSYVEIYNDGAASQALAGWVLGGATAGDSVALPGWTVPPGAYLNVLFNASFGSGTNDSDFSDGVGTYLDAASSITLLPTAGELGLYSGNRGSGTLVDFVGWGLAGSTFGDAYNHALIAGQWPPAAFVDLTGLSLLAHVARLPSGYDTDAPSDWQELEQPFLAPLTPHNALQLLPRDGTLSASVTSLSWKGVSGATDYYVEVDDDSAFGSPAVATTTGGTSLPVVLADGAYYWRVTPTLSGGPYPAAVWSFAQSGSISKQMPFSALPQRYQHKDSPLLCLMNVPPAPAAVTRPGCTENAGAMGPWDGAHAQGNHIPGCNHCNQYCTRASIQMVNHKFGGSLTQDEISYQLHSARFAGPEGDLGHGIGAWPAGAYSWALSGAAVARTWQGRAPNPYVNPTGMPWNVLTAQINADRPVLAVIEPPGWFHTVVYSGYFQVFGIQFAFITDPWPGRTNFYVNNRIHVVEYHTLPAGNIQGRQSNTDIGFDTDNDRFVDVWTDVDGDGVLDFDEGSPRPLQSLWYKPDTDDDGIADKAEIRSYTFHDSDHANHNNDALNFPDVDGDGARAENDCDTDGDQDYDNGEDVNGNGRGPQAGETCVYRSTDSNLALSVFNSMCESTNGTIELSGGTLAGSKTINVEAKPVACAPPAANAALAADMQITTDAGGNVSLNSYLCLPPGTYRVIVDAVQNGVFDPGCDPVLCDTIEGVTATAAVSALEAVRSEGAVTVTWWVASREAFVRFEVYRRPSGASEDLLLTAEGIPNAADAFPAFFRYVDESADGGRDYEYRLVAIDANERREEFGPVTLFSSPLVPARFAITSTQPNPFPEETEILFDLPRSEEVDLAVYDLAGRRVRELFRGRLPARSHRILWNGRGAAGEAVSPGVYLLRLKAGDATRTEKVVKLR